MHGESTERANKIELQHKMRGVQTSTVEGIQPLENVACPIPTLF